MVQQVLLSSSTPSYQPGSYPSSSPTVSPSPTVVRHSVIVSPYSQFEQFAGKQPVVQQVLLSSSTPSYQPGSYITGVRNIPIEPKKPTSGTSFFSAVAAIPSLISGAFNKPSPVPEISPSLREYTGELIDVKKDYSKHYADIIFYRRSLRAQKFEPGYTYTFTDFEGKDIVTSDAVEAESISDQLYKDATFRLRAIEGAQRNIQRQISDTERFHPSTEVIKTPVEDGGFKYEFKFPFAGAEDYYRYRGLVESDVGRSTALGWGWGGLGNIDVAFYRATGQSDRILNRQIEQLAQYDYAHQSLKSGDIKGFSSRYWLGYLSMPTTQIGMMYGMGSGAGAFSKFIHVGGYGAKTIAGQLAWRGVKWGVGGALVSYMSYHVAEPVIERGDVGESLGRGWVTGTGIAAGGAGYQSALGDSYGSVMAAKQKQPTFIKEIVKRIPSSYDWVQHKFPVLAPSGYTEPGVGVVSKPIGYQSIVGRGFSHMYQRVGSTRFAQNIYGWAAKGYVPARTYVMHQQGPPRYEGGYRVQDVLWKRGSFGERSFIPKEVANRFYTYVGGSGEIKIDFPSTRYLSGGDIRFTGVVEGKVVKFGPGRFTHQYFSSTIEHTISGLKPPSSVDMTRAVGSYYRDIGMVNIVKDVGKYPSYQLSHALGRYGDIGVRPYDETVFGKFVDIGFGSKYQPLGMPKSSTQWAKFVPSGLVKNVEASSSLILQSRTVQPHIFSSASYGKQWMHVPVSPFISIGPVSGFTTSTIGSSILTGVTRYKSDISSSGYIPVVEQVKLPSVGSSFMPVSDSYKDVVSVKTPISEMIQSNVPIVESIRTPIQSQIRVPAQTQIKVPALILIKEPIVIRTPTIKTPLIKTPTIPTVKMPRFIFFPDGIGGGGGWVASGMVGRRGKGYRFRKWKTPKVSSLLSGSKKSSKSFLKRIKIKKRSKW